MPSGTHWDLFVKMCDAIEGPLVTDAYVAALAIEHGCELITTDSDFARFQGRRWRHPFAGVAMKEAYTDKQGKYVAFIYYYSKIHGCAPSEAELQQYFRVSPPSVHQMILTLEARGLIERTPGQARSLHLRIPLGDLPDLI